jgi:VanZ family protein
MSCDEIAQGRSVPVIFEACRRLPVGIKKGPTGLLFRMRGWILVDLCLLWCFATVASLTPPDRLPVLPVDGKLLHVVGFIGLASLFMLTLTAYGHRGLRRGIVTLLVMSAYGALDEGTQPYFHRHGCVSDWLLDTVSAAAGLAMFYGLWALAELLARRMRLSRDMQRKAQRYVDAQGRAAASGMAHALHADSGRRRPKRQVAVASGWRSSHASAGQRLRAEKEPRA